MKPFRLLDLPPELWSRIVRYAATPAHKIRLRYDPRQDLDELEDAMTVTCTSKAIRAESLPTHHARTEFVYEDGGQPEDAGELAGWLATIPECYWIEGVVLKVESSAKDAETWVPGFEGHAARKIEERSAENGQVLVFKMRKKAC